MSQKQKIDTSSSQREGSGVFFLTSFLPEHTASPNNIQFQELAILPGGEILYNTDRIDPVAQADGPGNEIKELKTTKESRERSVFTTGAGKTALDYSKWRSGEFTHFFPNLASSNNIQFQELAILPRGEILYNTDRINPVAQADGPGNEIKELETTKESRERDGSEIRGYDFFLSLTRSVFTTGAGKTLNYSFNYNNR